MEAATLVMAALVFGVAVVAYLQAREARRREKRREVLRMMYAPTVGTARSFLPVVVWNPWNKVVQDHRDGAIDYLATDRVRRELGLPVPWVPEMAEEEVKQPPVYL